MAAREVNIKLDAIKTINSKQQLISALLELSETDYNTLIDECIDQLKTHGEQHASSEFAVKCLLAIGDLVHKYTESDRKDLDLRQKVKKLYAHSKFKIFFSNQYCKSFIDYGDQKMIISTNNLYPHQKKSLLEMEQRERCHTFESIHPNARSSARALVQYSTQVNSNIIILADKMGAGKTRTIVCLISRDMNHCPRFYNYATQLYGNFATQNYVLNVLDITIIIAGPSIISQWIDELDSWSIKTFHVKGPAHIPPKLETKCVYIMSPATISAFWNTFFTTNLYNAAVNLVPRRVVYDEPDSQNEPHCPNIDLAYSLIISSATSESILHIRRANKNALKNLFCRMGDYVLKLITVKQPDADIDASIRLPPYILHQVAYRVNAVMGALVGAGVIPQALSDALLAGANDEALRIMQEQYDGMNLIEIARFRLQKEINQIKANAGPRGLNDAQKDSIKELEKKQASIDNTIQERNEACPICTMTEDDLDPSSDNYEKELDSIKHRVLCPTCYHGVCISCLVKWQNDFKNFDCPMCKAANLPINKWIPQVVSRASSRSEEDKKVKAAPEPAPQVCKTRRDAFQRIITTILSSGVPNDRLKILIFSSYKEIMQNIANQLQNEHGFLTFEKLKGAGVVRDRIVDEFKHKNLNVLICNSVSDSAGLHLPETTHIIVCDNMGSPHLREQIIGRGQRIGRKEALHVYEIVEEF